MYQCCLETELNLKKEKQKIIDEFWATKAANRNELENLIKVQVLTNNILYSSIFLSYYVLFYCL